VQFENDGLLKMKPATSPKMLVSIHRYENLNLTHVLQFHVTYYQIIPIGLRPSLIHSGEAAAIAPRTSILMSHIMSNHQSHQKGKIKLSLCLIKDYTMGECRYSSMQS
jgi:hypothetical protein